eukprot:361902-Chlamydomonas_euryale.AAC.5
MHGLLYGMLLYDIRSFTKEALHGAKTHVHFLRDGMNKAPVPFSSCWHGCSRSTPSRPHPALRTLRYALAATR